ncbi:MULTISPECIES: CYTH domain-containing protein [Corallococcus]|uniref:CYTH domain-containing protein n=1 Tax=Corallococcus TaxID=83461 RepID=UPI00118115E1|nr:MULTISPECIES: CYTH domain-containing protein [Corallococcus]NBD08213.1 CYTH domain-containing protein [Corallococcus silvisoli]TSC34181.1 CYTH domain-containing protein [Corallococcus sp. Z5C101001]
MREVELKSVVDDVARCRSRVEAAGGTLRFAGTMEDRYYTRKDGGTGRLRIRTYQSPESQWSELTWKGGASLEHGYKVREELSTRVEDPSTLRDILERTGFTPGEHLTREIAWYACGDATLRFEQFPRMDLLVEVEGSPEAIEGAIRVTGIPRERFTADRLKEFIRRFEARTGTRAQLSGEAPVHAPASALD